MGINNKMHTLAIRLPSPGQLLPKHHSFLPKKECSIWAFLVANGQKQQLNPTNVNTPNILNDRVQHWASATPWA
jgi:hypothetical protein